MDLATVKRILKLINNLYLDNAFDSAARKMFSPHPISTMDDKTISPLAFSASNDHPQLLKELLQFLQPLSLLIKFQLLIPAYTAAKDPNTQKIIAEQTPNNIIQHYNSSLLYPPSLNQKTIPIANLL